MKINVGQDLILTTGNELYCEDSWGGGVKNEGLVTSPERKVISSYNLMYIFYIFPQLIVHSKTGNMCLYSK